MQLLVTTVNFWLPDRRHDASKSNKSSLASNASLKNWEVWKNASSLHFSSSAYLSKSFQIQNRQSKSIIINFSL